MKTIRSSSLPTSIAAVTFGAALLFIAVAASSLHPPRTSATPGGGDGPKDAAAPAPGGIAPRDWPAGERALYAQLNQCWDVERSLAETEHAMIAGTSGPLAIHAGAMALRRGGTAADAAIATALAQIVLSGGSWNSFAGILYAVCHDAASGEAIALGAGYAIPAGETDPRAIPASPTPSGRTTLVPGFMAGVFALHRKHGRLPLATLFAPAIELAEEGFPVDAYLAAFIAMREGVLSRRADTRAIFERPVGAEREGAPRPLLRKGDLFRQPALAATLRAAVRDGADHFYRGPWARRFVEAVRGEGGRVAMEDLDRYRAAWSEPLRTTYHGAEVCTVALPDVGGVQLLEALNVLEVSRITEKGHHAKSADALLPFIKIARLGHIITYAPAFVPGEGMDGGKGCDPAFAPGRRIAKDGADEAWRRVQRPGWEAEILTRPARPRAHSDGIVVVDAAGNVVSLVHSINALLWGTTGIFVDGVSIPDSANFQQAMMAKVGPGARLPNVVNPVIVRRDGKPILAASTIGSSLHECMLQNLVNVLDHGMDPKAALEAPSFAGPAWSESDPNGWTAQLIDAEAFAPSVLDEVRRRGQPLRPLGGRAPTEGLGTSQWVGVTIDPEKRTLRGAVDATLNGIVEGH